PLTDFRGKTSIFSHPVYLFLRKFSLQDSRGGSMRTDDIDRSRTRIRQEDFSARCRSVSLLAELIVSSKITKLYLS
ncbi:hypothetical protein C6546_17320, partial [Escherichia coli]|nr:hypothetical protein [Escherichia coli]NYW75352.1 hypothetical protein [Escherichia coli]NYX21079.1 hypothetical protein [Escherichia coli]NYX41861.1 hypothetical protein [Escherichia coli]